MHAKDTLGLIVSGKPDFLAVKDLKTNSLSDWEFGTLSLPDTICSTLASTEQMIFFNM